MALRNRVKSFLEDTGATINAFCRRIGISTAWYYRWMHEEAEFSDELCEKITTYLDEVYAK